MIYFLQQSNNMFWLLTHINSQEVCVLKGLSISLIVFFYTVAIFWKVHRLFWPLKMFFCLVLFKKTQENRNWNHILFLTWIFLMVVVLIVLISIRSLDLTDQLFEVDLKYEGSLISRWLKSQILGIVIFGNYNRNVRDPMTLFSTLWSEFIYIP